MQKVQLPFVKNEGQADKNISFYSKTFGCTVVVTKTGEIVYLLPQKTKNITLKEVLVGSKASGISGEDKAAANINYFLGKDREKWKGNIPVFNLVNFGEVYDGIGLKLKAYGRNVEKLFFIRPEADYKKIRLEMKGAVKIKVNPAGELEAETELGLVKFTKPVAYQDIDGKRVEVKVEYDTPQLLDSSTPQLLYGFKVGDYDRTKELIIDPLIASTFLGGNDDDQINAMALDSAGNVYVAGQTKTGANFPVTAGDTTHNGDTDVFVSKFSPDLSTLIASTYVGGTGEDIAHGIAIEPGGQVYITGTTTSSDFPAGSGVFQNSHAIDSNKKDAFIAKLDSGLTSVVSTFLGGDGDDEAMAVAIHSDGNIYVAGHTTSSNFPTAGAPFKAYCGTDSDANYSFNYCNRYGQGNTLIGTGDGGTTSFSVPPGTLSTPVIHPAADKVIVKVDSTQVASDAGNDGNLTGGGGSVSGSVDYSNGSLSITFTAAPANGTQIRVYYRHGSSSPQSDAFIVKMNGALSSLSAATYLGGSSDDYVDNIAISSNGNVYITGTTISTDFPTVADNRVQPVSGGMFDAFISKFDNTLANLTSSTYYGGADMDFAPAIAIKGTDADSTTKVYVGGSYTGGNAFVTKFSSDLSLAEVAKFIKGGETTDNSSNIVASVAVSGDDVYIAGHTSSSDILSATMSNSYDSKCGTNSTANCDKAGSTYYSDAFTAKLGASDLTVSASTYLGGSKSDNAVTIAVNSTTGKVYVAGYTKSSDFPALGGQYTAFGGGTDVNDAFVAMLDSNLSAAYISVSPSSVSFPVGDRVVFSSSGSTPSPKDVTITNSDTHSRTLAISDISIVGGNSSKFGKSTTCVLDQAMAQDAQCIVTVTFTPTTTAAVTDTLRISSNGTNGGTTTDILLSGTGVQQYSVTVTKAGITDGTGEHLNNGKGAIQSSNNATNGFNPDISCSPDGCPYQTRDFDAGLELSLQAYASADSKVTAWSGCLASDITTTPPTCTISDAGHSLDANKNISVTFSLKTYALTVSKDGTGKGTVTGAGTYNHGSTAELTASADYGSIFSGWSGDCAGSNSLTTVSMTGAKTCTATFTDNMAPTATISAISSPNNLTALEVTIGGTDVTHYKSKLDNGPYSEETAVAIPIALTALTDGSHTVSVIGRDAAGNWQSDSSPTTASWTVDTIAPTATISGTPASPANVATLTVAGTDVTHYKYKLDNGPFSEETAVAIPVTLTALTDGSHMVSVIGRDTAGNWQSDSSPATASWTVDATAPAATISGTPASPANVRTATLTVAGTDVTHYKYKLDNGPYSGETAVAIPVTLTALTDGSHMVSVIGRDTAGNWQSENSATTSSAWTIDATAPVASASPAGGSYNADQSVTLSADEAATIYYTTNGDVPTTGSHVYSKAVPITITGPGTTTVKFFAVDVAGNLQAAKTETYTISYLFDITTITALHGSVTCDSPAVSGSDSKCAISPEEGYHLVTLMDNGTDKISSVSGNSYTIANITAVHEITPSFAINTYTVTASVDTAGAAHGSILCDAETVNHGEDISCTITPGTGWRISNIEVTPGPDFIRLVKVNDTTYIYTFSEVTEDNSIVVYFSANAAGKPPVIAVSPKTYNFGKINIGSSSAAREFVISNSGKSDLVINSIDISGEDSSMFSLPATSGAGYCSLTPTIVAGKSCRIKVMFSPSSEGTRTAALSLSSNDFTKQPMSVTLKGTGLYTLTVTNSNKSGGSIKSKPAGINCGTDCSENYSGGVITLTASKKTGYKFTGWAGDCADTSVTCSITMDGNKNTTANFLKLFNIAGTIKSGAAGLKDVIVTVSGDGFSDMNFQTKASGAYRFTGLTAGTYTITPSKSGYIFIPETLQITISNASATKKNFSGTKQ